MPLVSNESTGFPMRCPPSTSHFHLPTSTYNPAMAAPGVISISVRAFDRWARFADGQRAPWVLAAWAVAESLVWPVLPDALLAPLVAAAPRRAARLSLASAGGAAVGGILLFAVASIHPWGMSTVLSALPLVFPSDIEVVRAALDQDGPAAYLRQPWSGIPFKVWGIVGAVEGIPLWFAAPVFVAARAGRMAAVTLLFAVLGRWLREPIRRHALGAGALYLIVFVLGWLQTMPILR